MKEGGETLKKMYEIILAVLVTALIVATVSSAISTKLEHDTAYKEGYRVGFDEGYDVGFDTHANIPLSFAADDISWQYNPGNRRIYHVELHSWVCRLGYNMTYEGLAYKAICNEGYGLEAYISYQTDNGLETITINEHNVGELICLKDFIITVLWAAEDQIIFEDLTP